MGPFLKSTMDGLLWLSYLFLMANELSRFSLISTLQIYTSEFNLVILLGKSEVMNVCVLETQQVTGMCVVV